MITLKRLPVRSLASGAVLDIAVYAVRGTDPAARRTYIQSSMHGAEVQGNAVIAELLEVFARTPPRGDIVLVPNANPFAVIQKSGEYTLGRFDPTTGDNWNRNYWLPQLRQTRRLPWEQLKQKTWARMATELRSRLRGNLPFGQRLALTLQSLTVGADYVIDLHCANVSARHLYTPDYAEDAARYFRIPLILSIPGAFGGAMDESVSCAWWSFFQELEAQGYPQLPSLRDIPQGYTLELGDQEVISRTEAARDAAGILNFLRHKGVVSGRVEKPAAALVCDLQDYRTIYSRHAGHVDFTAAMGVPAAKGQQLAQTLQFGATARWVPTLAEEDCVPVLHHSSAVVHEGSELIKVFTNVRRV
jgi:predicted deacylase